MAIQQKKARGGKREGAGRPTLSEDGQAVVRVMVNLTHADKARLDAFAKANALKQSEALRLLLRMALDTQEKE